MTTNPTRSGPTGRQLRVRQRGLHLVTAALVLMAVSAGPLLGPAFAAAVQWVVFPVLALSGVAMWQWPRIRRGLRERAGAPAR